MLNFFLFNEFVAFIPAASLLAIVRTHLQGAMSLNAELLTCSNNACLVHGCGNLLSNHNIRNIQGSARPDGGGSVFGVVFGNRYDFG